MRAAPRVRSLDGLAATAYARYVSFAKRRMGWGRLGVLAMGLSYLASGEASAFTGIRGAQQGRVLASGAQARTQRDVAWQAPTAARREYTKLTAQLALAQALWDRDTGVPLRMWGAGTHVPGSVASATAAARTSRELLTAHLAVLAPGARASDFVLAGNHLGAGIRSVGFVQTFAGRPVIGGQLSFRFKRDRLVSIGSEAFPQITVTLTNTPIAAATARRARRRGSSPMPAPGRRARGPSRARSSCRSSSQARRSATTRSCASPSRRARRSVASRSTSTRGPATRSRASSYCTSPAARSPSRSRSADRRGRASTCLRPCSTSSSTAAPRRPTPPASSASPTAATPRSSPERSARRCW